MALTMNSYQSEVLPFFNIADKISILGKPGSPRFGHLELQFSDPLPSSWEAEDAVGVSHHVHRLVSELLKYLINPSGAFPHRLIGI